MEMLALTIAIVGFLFAIFALTVATSIAIRKRKPANPLPNGVYKMHKVGTQGDDDIFEIEPYEEESS